jgi:hypothetical protein
MLSPLPAGTLPQPEGAEPVPAMRLGGECGGTCSSSGHSLLSAPTVGEADEEYRVGSPMPCDTLSIVRAEPLATSGRDAEEQIGWCVLPRARGSPTSSNRCGKEVYRIPYHLTT